jgi:hypothetical protein
VWSRSAWTAASTGRQRRCHSIRRCGISPQVRWSPMASVASMRWATVSCGTRQTEDRTGRRIWALALKSGTCEPCSHSSRPDRAAARARWEISAPRRPITVGTLPRFWRSNRETRNACSWRRPAARSDRATTTTNSKTGSWSTRNASGWQARPASGWETSARSS